MAVVRYRVGPDTSYLSSLMLLIGRRLKAIRNRCFKDIDIDDDVFGGM
jgi:hypothetical protein